MNSAYAFVLYTLSPPPTFSRAGFTGTFTGTGTGFAGAQFRQTGSETGFIISSFIIGFIFVIAICGIALAYARFRGKGEHEEDEVDDDEKALSEDLGKLEDT